MPTVAIRASRQGFGRRYRRTMPLHQEEIDTNIPAHFNSQHPNGIPMDDTVAIASEIPQSDVDSR